jgi:hypothetical protein
VKLDEKIDLVASKQSLALRQMGEKIDMVTYKQSHVLSKASQQKVETGALFYIIGGGAPMFCGFFVSPRIALTVNHSPMFNTAAGRAASSTILGCCPTLLPPRALEFELVSTDAAFDFSVLRLKAGQEDAPAFFDIPSYGAVVTGVDLGLVTMSIGSGAALEAPPQISQHRVSVSGLDRDGFFLYDGASTWRGDSGGALLFEEGSVVGLHLEVVDDKPALPFGIPQPRHYKGGGTLRALGKDVAAVSDAVERVSEAASSSSKVCRALLLTHPRVLMAVGAAGGGGRAPAGGGGGGAF